MFRGARLLVSVVLLLGCVTQLPGQRRFRSLSQDKGQPEAIRAVIAAVQKGEPSPFSTAEIVNVSRTTFAMLESAAAGEPVSVKR